MCDDREKFREPLQATKPIPGLSTVDITRPELSICVQETWAQILLDGFRPSVDCGRFPQQWQEVASKSSLGYVQQEEGERPKAECHRYISRYCPTEEEELRLVKESRHISEKWDRLPSWLIDPRTGAAYNKWNKTHNLSKPCEVASRTRRCAERVKKHCQTGAEGCRLAGEYFLMLCNHGKDSKELRKISKKLLCTMPGPTDYRGMIRMFLSLLGFVRQMRIAPPLLLLVLLAGQLYLEGRLRSAWECLFLLIIMTLWISALVPATQCPGRGTASARMEVAGEDSDSRDSDDLNDWVGITLSFSESDSDETDWEGHVSSIGNFDEIDFDDNFNEEARVKTAHQVYD